ncbi:hypothetical protein SDC9_04124 [bioreactor metagenome]|uniref:Uncharacterized protein n=1 Tax=bioreactor metagenome TaxID=1076179 RepID=A0A644SV63_9ZZZZ|nr:hypothetical protein [Negativicutes bacterium]
MLPQINADRVSSFVKRNVLPLIIGLIVGCLVAYVFFPRTVATTQTVDKPIYVAGEVKTEKIIEYIAKEQGENTDVQIKSDPAKIIVNVNGKETQLDTLTGETQKFEKGKLVISENTTAKLDVSDMVNELSKAREKRNMIGGIATNHGPAAVIGRDNVIGVIGKDVYGAGLVYKF